MEARLWRLLLTLSFITPIVFSIYFWYEARLVWPPSSIVIDKVGYFSLASFFTLITASLAIRLFKAPRSEALLILRKMAYSLILINIVALTIVLTVYWWFMGGFAHPPPLDAVLRKIVGRRPVVIGVLASMLFSAVVGYVVMHPEQRKALNKSIRILIAASLAFSPAYIQWILLTSYAQAFIKLSLHQAQTIAFTLLIVGVCLLTWIVKGVPPRLSGNVKPIYERILRVLRRPLRGKAVGRSSLRN